MSPEAVIEVAELVKSHGGQRVLNGVDLTVRRGEVACVIGPSGGGKSTLLRCVNGLEAFEAGSVRVGEIALTPEAARPDLLVRLRRSVGMVFQQFHLFPHLTVLDNVLAGPVHALGESRASAEPRARELLRRVGLEAKAADKPARLSGGQQQRVAIARALAVNPAAILFDEPTSALDPVTSAEVLRVMADLAAAGQTMVVVTHAMAFAREAASTVHVMHAGRVAESGPPERVFGEPAEQVTRDFLRHSERN